MRPIVSYDDITSQPPESPTNPPPPQPPAKKRKTFQPQRQGGLGLGRAQPQQSVQHWDDPGNQGLHVHYNDTPATTSSENVGSTTNTGMDEKEDFEEEEEESRELTHEEIWDDSALIDAWNSAAAEYEAYHGSGKRWKEEPIKKSPLWYNVPPATTFKPKAKSKATTVSKGTNSKGTNLDQAHVDPADYGTDSAPLNFDTFVPTHDPSLATVTGSTMSGVSGTGVGAEASAVGQDEAFSRALTATYWSGYWTAVYHCRRNELALQDGMEDKEDMAEVEHNRFDEGDDEDDDEELLPAQR